MIQPTDLQPAWPRRQVETASGPVTCATCGCRLERDTKATDAVWRHFTPLGGRDARGCSVACVDLPHDAHGRLFAGLTA